MAARRAVFWPPGRILARKSVFCYRTPDFVNGPFVALAKAIDLAPSDPFFDFSFPSYGRFREGDPLTQQKVLPHPTVGTLFDSNSPSALDNILCMVDIYIRNRNEISIYFTSYIGASGSTLEYLVQH